MMMLRVLISLECNYIIINALNVNTSYACINYLFLKKKILLFFLENREERNPDREGRETGLKSGNSRQNRELSQLSAMTNSVDPKRVTWPLPALFELISIRMELQTEQLNITEHLF